MVAEDTANDVTSSASEHPARMEETAFAASEWQDVDTTQLQPHTLALPKIQRAWDRKPQSPFSKDSLRVGKVWKRPNPASTRFGLLSSDARRVERATKRTKTRHSPLQHSQMKPIKKLCLDAGFGVGAQVQSWDAHEWTASPVRKIVTRSGAAGERLVELSEDEETPQVVDEEEGGVTVEIVDEDGTVLEVRHGAAAYDDTDWEDEGSPEGHDATLMHLADAFNSPRKMNRSTSTVAHVVDDNELVSTGPEADNELLTPMPSADHEAFSVVDPIPPIDAGGEMLNSSTVRDVTKTIALPEGFVSPVKRLQRRSRKATSGRRRTLPIQFAPTLGLLQDQDECQKETEAPTTEVAATQRPEILGNRSASENGVFHKQEEAKAETAADRAEEVSVERQHQAGKNVIEESERLQKGENGGSITSTSVLQGVMHSKDDAQGVPKCGSEVCEEGGTAVASVEAGEDVLSSQIRDCEVETLKLPLRRSPRRKSTSPAKPSTILHSRDTPHLVAFSPIKRKTSRVESPTHPESRLATSKQYTAMTGIDSDSAPSDVFKLTAQKTLRPRVSDDTALLQAFLSRAATSKSSQGVSTARRESMTNRRDSDAVRQALASPAKTEVLILGDLDPNSPSPRKSDPIVEVDGEEERFEEAPRTRRSGRAIPGRPGLSHEKAAGPNRICIRGNGDGIVLKRTEAQELALLTRNNTRKNKGGAALPPLRLQTLLSSDASVERDATIENLGVTSQIAKEDIVKSHKGEKSDAVNGTQRERARGARGIKWSRFLVEFDTDGMMNEAAILDNEQNRPLDIDPPEPTMPNNSVAPVAPAETPSKPKMRRLKSPRTAVTPAAKTSAESRVTMDEPVAVKDTAVQVATKKRSRIATPAKGLTNASLLPADLAPTPAVEKRPSVGLPAKKPAISKLPAPSISATAAQIGQGKENGVGLIASPPKKKASALTAPTSKIFAPKLDFGKPASLAPPTAPLTESLPGLMSPAKKAGGRRGVNFISAAGGSAEARDREEAVNAKKEAIGGMPGFSSPAKKRTRRAV